ncbi:MAG TPA: malto-oligosyltrehalose synthase [Stellaceae bacterium]|jgi:(1->4)-alpha-D-glucan 1-alpha-D-glucosylmutase|nr:malto-oligosyltrehalose synthase [Stellaceae bacterium]
MTTPLSAKPLSAKPLGAKPPDAKPPGATYRMQFHAGFTFADAVAMVDYLADLGITHLYASPILSARPGSAHGYDVVDPTTVNPELGGEEGFLALSTALKRRGLGLIVDIVPNHMGVGEANDWWMDVLEWGRRSPYAKFFDIDWDAALPAPTGRILLPILGSPFGAALDAGEIALHFAPETGRFQIHYYDNWLPVAPWLYADLLDGAAARLGADAAAQLAHLAKGFAKLAKEKAGDLAAPHTRALELRRRLAELCAQDPATSQAIGNAAANLAAVPGDPASTIALGRLLEAQAYRLSWWRLAADAINYRRFFNINDLAGLRMERGEVFRTSHRKILELVAGGHIQGLRIDHIDGLADPKAYLEDLQSHCGGTAENPFYVVVEKIVAENEELPSDWPCAGTTGYEDINLLTRLFCDPAGEASINEAYRWFTKRDQPFAAVLHQAKRLIIEVDLAGEVSRIVRRLIQLAAENWHYRDFAIAAIRRAVQGIIVHLPVYRTYVDETGVRPVDRRLIEQAAEAARAEVPDFEAPIYDFMIATLCGEGGPEALAIAKAFQQVSGPAMAKGLEDTGFYRYFAMIALNEVGGDPRLFAIDTGDFHRAMINRPQQRPLAMIAGTTHDTKRGEDARARLTGIAAKPEFWIAAVERWTALARELSEIDSNDAYYIYQSMLGAWPMGLAAEDADGLDAFRERLETAVFKALREGKERSSWTDPDEAYEEKVKAFIAGSLDPTHGFLADFVPVATCFGFWGACTSLAETLIRHTMPGVPDLYRGAELWELSFVDPDNRRPLDVAQLLNAPMGTSLPELMTGWRDGRVKQELIRRLLAVRREMPDLFTIGSYTPLVAIGDKAAHVVAFARQAGEEAIAISVTARLWPILLPLNETMEGTATDFAVAWDDTAIPLPPGRYREVLGEREIEITPDTAMPVAEILGHLPVALLVKQRDAT